MNEDIVRELNYRIENLLEHGRAWLEDDEVRDTIDSVKEETEHFIRKHPLRSVAIGLFAGYVLGKIFSPED